MLSGTQVLAQDMLSGEIRRQASKRLAHEQLRTTAPHYLRVELLPRLRALAEHFQASEGGQHAPDRSRSEDIGELRNELQRVKLALLDSVAAAGAHVPAADAPSTSTERHRARAADTIRAAVARIDRLDACCRHLSSNNALLRRNAIIEMLDLTAPPPPGAPPTAPLPHAPQEPAGRSQELPASRYRPHDQSLPGADRRHTGSGTLLDISGIPREPRLHAAAGDVLWPSLADVPDSPTSGPGTAADLAFSPPQTCRSTRVESLAANLATPARIFEYFRNRFVYEPYFGLVKGAEQTLAEMAGNDADIASAMISVLRTAGVPCRYVYGTIRLTAAQAAAWLGVAASVVPELLVRNNIPHRIEGPAGIGDVVVDRVWVKAYIDYSPYRGAVAPEPAGARSAEQRGDAWIDIDPSFKRHSFTPRRELERDLGINTEVFRSNVRTHSTRGVVPDNAGLKNGSGGNACDDHVTGLPRHYILSEVLAAAEPLAEIMMQHGLTLDTVFRERIVCEEVYGILPCTDQYEIVARGAAFARFPEALETVAELWVGDEHGREQFTWQLPVAACPGREICLRYVPATEEDASALAEWNDPDSNGWVPAYLADVLPELWIDGARVAAGAVPLRLGARQVLRWTVIPAGTDPAVFPASNRSRILRLHDRLGAGERTVFVFAAGQVTDERIARVAAELEREDAPLETMLRAIGLNYFYQADHVGRITAGVLNHYARRDVSLLRVSCGLDVEELLGCPYRVRPHLLRTAVLRDAFSISPLRRPLPGEPSTALAAAVFTFCKALVSSVLETNNLRQTVGTEPSSPVGLLLRADAAAIPIMTLAPDSTRPAGQGIAPTLGREVFTGLDLGLSPATQDMLLGYLNQGCTVTFPARSPDARGVDRDAVVAVDPLTGSTGFLQFCPGYATGLIAGCEVALDEQSPDLRSLLADQSVPVPAGCAARLREWLYLLPDATLNTGLSFLPAIMHVKNMLVPMHSAAAATPEHANAADSLPATLALSSLTTTAAVIALLGRVEEICRRPGILNSAAGPDVFSPNEDGIQDAFAICAIVTGASAWTIRFTDAHGAEVAVLTPADNQPPNTDYAGIVDVLWPGLDTAGSPVAEGRCNFTLTATGEGGSVSLSGATVIDRTPPRAELAVELRKLNGRTVVTFSGTADDRHFASYSVTLEDAATGAAIAELTGGNLPVIDGGFVTLDASELANGTYHAVLTVRDMGGNVATARTAAPFAIDNPVVDLTAPELSVRSAICDPNCGVLNGTIRVEVSAFDAGGIATLEVHLDGVVLAAVRQQSELSCNVDCTAIDDGIHTLQAMAKDLAGNEARSPAFEFLSSRAMPDTVPPRLTLDLPDTSLPLADIFSVMATASDNVAVASIQILLDGAVLAEIAHPDPAELGVLVDAGALTPGNHTIVARALDTSGNLAVCGPVLLTTVNTTPDATPPTVGLRMPDPAQPLRGDIRVTATASDNVGVIRLELLLDGLVIVALSNPRPVELTHLFAAGTLAAGAHTLQARALDAAGNVGATAEVGFTVDPTAPDGEAPAVELYAPGTASPWTGQIPVRAVAFDNVGVTRIRLLLDGAEFASADHPEPAELTASIDTALLDEGQHTLAASANDAGGLTATTDPPVVFTVGRTAPDTTAPVVIADIGGVLAIDSRTGATEYRVPNTLIGDVDIRATATDNTALGSLRILLDNEVAAARTATDGALHLELAHTLEAANLPDGIHTLRFEAEDAAGNTSACSVLFTSDNDTTAPSVTMQTSMVAPAAPVRGDIVVRVTAADNRAVSQIQLFLDDVLFRSVSSPVPAVLNATVPAELLSDAVHTLRARAVDPAGNEAWTEPLVFTSSNPITRFTVAPERIEPGLATGANLTVVAELKQEGAWTLAFQGPSVLPELIGTSAMIHETLDLAGQADGNYTVTLAVAGIEDRPVRSFVLNLIDGPPVANIANFSGQQIHESSAHRVTAGLLELHGTADDPDPEDAVRWKIELFTPDGALVRNVTPDPGPDGWNHSRVSVTAAVTGTDNGTADSGSRSSSGGGEGVGPDNSGTATPDGVLGAEPLTSFGTVDFSLLGNGIYELHLTVQGGQDIRTDQVRIALDSQLKVGQFAFSQQDLVIPVSGMPISVIRSYNSLAASDLSNPSDFAPGWTYAIADVDMELDERRVLVDGDTGRFSQRDGGGRNVTVTLPDGRRTTFVFRLRRGAGFHYRAEWEAAPGVYATLVPVLDNRLTVLPFNEPYWEAAGMDTPWHVYDFPAFVLTTKDGTQYRLEREDLGFHGVFTAQGETYSVQAYGKGRLTRIDQRNGNRIEFGAERIDHYNGEGSRTRSIVFERDGNGRIAAVYTPDSLDENGNVNDGELPAISYEYEDGKLWKVHKLVQEGGAGIPPAYDTVEYVYDNPAFPYYITAVVDPRGIQPLRTEYDDNGRVIATIDAFGNRIELEHNLAERTETVYDRLGNPTIHLYDEHGNVVTTIDAHGNRTIRTYDSAGNETSLTDPLGNTTRQTYDSTGNRTSTTDALGNTTYFDYNAFGNVTAITNALGQTTRFDFDDTGKVLTRTDALSRTTTFAYDANGLLSGYTNPDGICRMNDLSSFPQRLGLTTLAPDGTTLVAWEEHFDSRGNMLRKSTVRRLPDGTVTEPRMDFRYDAAGRLLEVVNDLGMSVAYEYDETNKCLAVTASSGLTVAYEYDLAGRLVQTVQPNGETAEYVYDAEDRPLSVTAGGLTTMTTYDALGRTRRTTRNAGTESEESTWYTYDAAGRLVEERSGEHWQRYEYDAAGRVIRRSDWTGTTVETTYDALGNAVGTKIGDVQTRILHDSVGRRTGVRIGNETFGAVEYDAGGRPIRETAGNGTVLEREYDPLGNLTRIYLRGINSTDKWFEVNVQYDEMGHPVRRLDALGRATAFTYDNAGRLLGETRPDGRSRSFEYAGTRLSKTTEFDGRQLVFEYDSLGRVTRTQTTSADGTSSTTKEFRYNDRGLLSEIHDERGISLMGYDAFGRLTSRHDPVIGPIRYDWDARGNCRSVYTATHRVDYTYDDFGRVLAANSNAETATVVYGNGSLESVAYPNGIVRLYDYDPRSRATCITYLDSQTESRIGQFTAFYDQTGRCVQTASDDGWNGSFAYNEIGLLTAETWTNPGLGFNRSIAYEYDAAGNRVRMVRDDEVLDYTYAEDGDHLLAVTSSVAGVTAFDYDDHGRLLAVHMPDGTQSNLTYELNGRLSGWSCSGADGESISMAYGYDAWGNRVAETMTGPNGQCLSDRRFRYDIVTGPVAFLFEECNPDGADNIGHVRGPGGVLWSRTEAAGGDVAEYYLADTFRNVRRVLDGERNPVTAAGFDAFGNPLPAADPLASRFGYRGEVQDVLTGLVHLRAREYLPEYGRFNAPDPWEGSVEAPVTLHRYIYAGNDPLQFSDPTGMFLVVELLATSNTSQTLAMAQLSLGRTVRGHARVAMEHAIASQMYQMVLMNEREHANACLLVHGIIPDGQEFGWSSEFGAGLRKIGVNNQDFQEFRWSGFQFGTALGFEFLHSLASVATFSGIIGEVFDFFQNTIGNMNRIDAIATDSLTRTLDIVQTRGYANVNVLSHSWGTFLAHRTLYTTSTPVTEWFTFGSPLGANAANQQRPGGVRQWHNVCSLKDLVCTIAPSYASVLRIRGNTGDAGGGQLFMVPESSSGPVNTQVEINGAPLPPTSPPSSWLPPTSVGASLKEHSLYWKHRALLDRILHRFREQPPSQQ